MASTELDLPIVPSADQIRRREFATSRRGYDPDQVRQYLSQISEQVEHLEEQIKAARTGAELSPAPPTPIAAPSEPESIAQDVQAAELNAAQLRIRELELERDGLTQRLGEAQAEAAKEPSQDDAYEALARRMADVLRTAEQQADQVRWQAEEDAVRVLEDARAEADRVRTDAQAKAEETRGEADKLMDTSREEADRLLSGLASKRDAMMSELEHMRERMLTMATSLGEIAGPVDPTDGGRMPADPKYFSESQLEQLWSADTVPQVDLTLPDIPGLDDDETKNPF